MKKMKKFVALALAGAMVLGMSTTAMAATNNSATITVNNVEGATLKYVQVIEPSTTSLTGWVFTDDTIANCYTDAFGLTDNDENTAAPADATDIIKQAAIAMMIKKVDSEATFNTSVPAVNAVSDGQLDAALNNVLNSSTVTEPMDNPETVDEAGVYAIHAVGKNYTYKVMSAYVGFGEATVDGDTFNYPALVSTTVEAKKIETTITKADDDKDNAVAIDQRVTYTLETNFPYFKTSDVNKTFQIYDKIVGASYVDLDNVEKAYVTIGGEKVAAKFDQTGNWFVVDLSGYVDNANTYAGKEVVVTYDAIVDATHVRNQAASRVGGEEYYSEEINLYSGEITLLKYDAADKNTVLANAEFNVKDAQGNVLTFKYDETNNVYRYDKDLSATAEYTTITTGEDGKVKVEGLDLGTYTFVETKAPERYTINETPVTATLTISEDVATAIFTADTEMSDTKLIALPSTGGIGTTIFTIGGVAIILAAAAMLFARRRVAR